MSLNSTSVIKIVDLLCEGPIEEIVGGKKGIFLNDTAVVDNNGDENFPKKDVKYQLRTGTRNQKQFEDHKKANSNIIDISQEVGSNYTEELNEQNEVKKETMVEGKLLHR